MLEAEKLNLGDLVKKLEAGEIQLPDFQRSWIWDNDQIKSLLESVIRGFPINSILLLECNADDTKFAFRPIQGVEKIDAKPQTLILDGQQRLTSLFGSLFSDKPVEISKGKKFFYYVDMKKAIEAVKNSVTDEDLIISVSANKKLKAKGKNWDLSTPEKEFAADMFPLNKIFKSNRQWFRGYEKFHNGNDSAEKFMDTFADKIIDKVNDYEVVAIKLKKETPLEAVCRIFEKVNIGIAKLDVFDLLTAIFAAKKDERGEPIKLRRDWENVQIYFASSGSDILTEIDCSDFITALTLLVSYEKFRADKKISVSCKGEDILKLEYNDYLDYKPQIVEGFVDAAKFLDGEGITTAKYLPYKTQLIPMAAIFAELKLSGKDNAAAVNKIRQWYWCCVFSESYKDGQGTRYAKDIVQIMKWIDKREEPEIIRKAQIVAGRLMSVNNIRSAAYKGIISLIIKNGAQDFLAGRVMGTSANFAENIEIHHIFPKKFCETRGLTKTKYDNPANKTLILKKTNQTIGGNAPSIYLKKIQEMTKLSNTELNEILEKHFIDPELCRADNFEAFIDDRAKKIFDAIEKLTGREVVGRQS